MPELDEAFQPALLFVQHIIYNRLVAPSHFYPRLAAPATAIYTRSFSMTWKVICSLLLSLLLAQALLAQEKRMPGSAKDFVASGRSLSERARRPLEMYGRNIAGSKTNLRPALKLDQLSIDRALLLRPLLPLVGRRVGSSESGGTGAAVQASKMTIEGNVSVGRAYSSTAAPADGMIIQGNVGIGTPTPNPGIKLDIQGSVSTFNGVSIGLYNANAGNTNQWVLGTGGAVVPKDAFSIGDTSTYKMVILPDGRVGIGNLDPIAKLDVLTTTPGQAGLRVRGGDSTCNACSNGVGVFAIGGSGNGEGILAYSNAGANDGTAGQFDGDVFILHNLQVNGTKNFKIDHPLDPENKYLLHAAIESSEVLNVYSGNVTTDENGVAVVTLPDWFETLNKDFRYQLTVIGTFAQAIIASEVKHNRFTIQTSAPGVKVSWQVTGVRSDAVMLKHPFKAEEEKPEGERGTYLSPEAFGQPEEKGVEWARRPELMRQMKEQREKAQREQLQKGHL
jgi:hypothetical protein